MDLMQRLQRWYSINCNGDWEHSYGVSITNVDNPGWWVTIDLQETCLQAAVLPQQPTVTRTPTNWVFWRIENQQFIASGGPENLTEILRYFLDTLLPKQCDPTCTYEVYLPVPAHENLFWLRGEGRIISESVLELTSIEDPQQPGSYDALSEAGYAALHEADLTSLRPMYAVGERVEPYIQEAAANMLKKLLVASWRP